MLTIELANQAELKWAQAMVSQHHYLRRPVDVRCSPVAYIIRLAQIGAVGCLIFGRPQATRCYPWYGGVGDVQSGRAECTRWQVLNLARVWIHPSCQPHGPYHSPNYLPGFHDRKSEFRSTLASDAINEALRRVGYEYLLCKPPVFLEEPIEIEWVLSYCDLTKHKGSLYRAAGFDLYRSSTSIYTYRRTVPALTPEQDNEIRALALTSQRSRRIRAEREQAKRQMMLEMV